MIVAKSLKLEALPWLFYLAI